MSDIQASARVQLTLEVHTSVWGEDCTIGQLYKQAADDGVNEVRKLVVESKCKAVIIGQPKVIGVITDKATLSE